MSTEDREIGRLKSALEANIAVLRHLGAENAELRAKRFVRFNNEECWIYQGDGSDHLESLVCPVVISTRQLQYILGEIQGAEDADRLRRALQYLVRQIDANDQAGIRLGRINASSVLNGISVTDIVQILSEEKERALFTEWYENANNQWPMLHLSNPPDPAESRPDEAWSAWMHRAKLVIKSADN